MYVVLNILGSDLINEKSENNIVESYENMECDISSGFHI